MKSIIAIVALACVMAPLSAADLVDDCRTDLLLALADIHLPDDVRSLIDQARVAHPEKSLAQLEASDLEGAHLRAPDQCRDYVIVLEDLMLMDSCNAVDLDEQLTARFWASIPKDSALDSFMGALKVCTHLSENDS